MAISCEKYSFASSGSAPAAVSNTAARAADVDDELDMDNFTTWSLMTFDTIDYRKFIIPIGGHIAEPRSYFVTVMILWY